MNAQTQTAPRPQTALAPPMHEDIETAPHALALIPSTLAAAWQLAEWLAASSSLAPALRGKPADIFSIVLAGIELGLPPMATLRGIYIVNGKTAMEGKTKAAICLKRGAALYIKRTEYTPLATTWETWRRGQTDCVRLRFTLEEATKSGLTKKQGPWQEYPQRMISHRALGWLLDDTYPDILMGVATSEDFYDADLQPAFRAIGGGMEIANPPEARAPAPPPPAAPATAKAANEPVAGQPGATGANSPASQEAFARARADSATIEATRAAATPSQPVVEATGEEIEALEIAITDCTTVDALRKVGARISKVRMDGGSRERLQAVYGDTLSEIKLREHAEAELARAQAGGAA